MDGALWLLLEALRRSTAALLREILVGPSALKLKDLNRHRQNNQNRILEHRGHWMHWDQMWLSMSLGLPPKGMLVGSEFEWIQGACFWVCLWLSFLFSSKFDRILDDFGLLWTIVALKLCQNMSKPNLGWASRQIMLPLLTPSLANNFVAFSTHSKKNYRNAYVLCLGNREPGDGGQMVEPQACTILYNPLQLLEFHFASKDCSLFGDVWG